MEATNWKEGGLKLNKTYFLLWLHVNLSTWICFFGAWKKMKNLLPNGGEKWWVFMVQSEASPCETNPRIGSDDLQSYPNPTSVDLQTQSFPPNGWNLTKINLPFPGFWWKISGEPCFSISGVYLFIYLIEASATPLHPIYSSLSFRPYQVASTIYNESWLDTCHC